MAGASLGKVGVCGRLNVDYPQPGLAAQSTLDRDAGTNKPDAQARAAAEVSYRSNARTLILTVPAKRLWRVLPETRRVPT